MDTETKNFIVKQNKELAKSVKKMSGELKLEIRHVKTGLAKVIEKEIERLAQSTANEFSVVYKHFDDMDKRFDAVDDRFENLENQIGEIKKDMLEVKADVRILKGEVRELKQDGRDTKADIVEMKDTMRELRSGVKRVDEIDPLRDKILVLERKTKTKE